MPLGSLGRIFGCDLAIDPGSESVRALGRSGEVVAVPSVLARVEPGHGSFLRRDLVGESAKTVESRSAGEGAEGGRGSRFSSSDVGVTIFRPISHGAVRDIAAAERLFAHVFREAPGRTWGARPRVVAGAGAGLSTVELRATSEALEGGGAKVVRLVPGLVACALALERSERTAEGAVRLILELGAERTGVGIASRTGVVVSAHLPLGFSDIDRALAGALARRGLAVSLREATQLREGLGLPASGSSPARKGLLADLADIEDVLPRDVGAAIEPFLLYVADAVRGVLSRAPEGVAENLFDYGAALAGAPGATPGLAEFLEADLELPVRAAPDGAALRVRGLALLAEEGDLLAHVAVEA